MSIFRGCRWLRSTKNGQMIDPGNVGGLIPAACLGVPCVVSGRN